MELHSYAKLRGYKKWTIEQKRRLVQARINYDGIFSRKSANCVDSWKKIIQTAKLNDFNVSFVRKQWANLLARYKSYKRTRLRQLGKNGEINEEIAREISEEWEFFLPLHSFMSKKPTNFHSYAQNPYAADENGKTRKQEEDESRSKSLPPPNTDHDFYSKSAYREIQDIKMEPDEYFAATATVSSEAQKVYPEEQIISDHQEPSCSSIKIETEQVQQNVPVKKTKKKPKPSERDKYYKHKRRYDRRNERRFDALLNVVGQVVKQHFPNVDISKLDAQTDRISTEDENSTSETVCMEDDSETSCTALSSDESGL